LIVASLAPLNDWQLSLAVISQALKNPVGVTLYFAPVNKTALRDGKKPDLRIDVCSC